MEFPFFVEGDYPGAVITSRLDKAFTDTFQEFAAIGLLDDDLIDIADGPKHCIQVFDLLLRLLLLGHIDDYSPYSGQFGSMDDGRSINEDGKSNAILPCGGIFDPADLLSADNSFEMIHYPFPILGDDHLKDVQPFLIVLLGITEGIECDAVDENEISLVIQFEDRLRQQICQFPEPQLALVQCLFGCFSPRYILHCALVKDDVSVIIKECLCILIDEYRRSVLPHPYCFESDDLPVPLYIFLENGS